jgi:cytochrome c oxidase assembly protein subunit 15
MIDAPVRPVPRWLHVWAVATAIATLVLLALGQLVTSFQAGMADPIWPTEPWYLFMIDWQEPSRGYLIEHTHRIAAFTVGGMVSVLALGLWWTDPNRATRWAGLAAVMILLAGFGQFHGGLIAQRNVPTAEIRLPVGGTVVTLAGLGAALALALSGLVRRAPGSLLRFLGVTALVGVMIQGLFGGFRVMLNELVGTDLATVHGIFAQVIFCLLIAIAVLTGPRQSAETQRPYARILDRGAVILVVVLFTQIVLGAFVRHAPSPLTQRLHFLMAFVAAGFAVWLLFGLKGQPAARVRVKSASWWLGLLLALQVVLGVEAWMAKFGQYTLPDLVKITTQYAVIRTAHALVGSCLLATAVVIALRLKRPSGMPIATPDRTNSEWSDTGGYESRNATVSSGV